MDITQMSITELKALAYDTISQLEQAQSNLQAINREIAARRQAEQMAAKAEPEASSAD